MTMEQHDRRFESFLREFQPRRPRALPVPQPTAPSWARRLAATVALATALGCSLWIVSRRSLSEHSANPATQETAAQLELSSEHLPALVPLTRLALEDPARLDAALTEASRNVLPTLRRRNSTLRLLAKE
jgi:hypothetical protein